jgi:hypothetical protein
VAQCFCRLSHGQKLRLRRTTGGLLGVLGGSAQLEVGRTEGEEFAFLQKSMVEMPILVRR